MKDNSNRSKCPNCNDSTHTVKKGFRIVNNQTMQRMYCKDCRKTFLVETEHGSCLCNKNISNINTDPKFKCPQCGEFEVLIKNTTKIQNKNMQRCFCKSCNAFFVVPIDEDIDRTAIKTNCINQQEHSDQYDGTESPLNTFYCYCKYLNMAFPMRIRAHSPFHAAEIFANDICTKINNGHELLESINNFIVHIFDSDNKLCAIYKSKEVKIEFDSENIYDLEINNI